MKYIIRLFNPLTWPIAAKISVALVCAVLIPMIFTVYYNLQQSLDSVEAGEYHKLKLLASSTASRLDQLIIDHHRVVAQISSDRHVVDFMAADTSQKREAYQFNLQSTLQNILRFHPDIDAVLLMDRKGNCLAATDTKFIGQNYSSIQSNFYGFSLLLDETSKTPGMFFSQPVRSPRGEIMGVTLIKIRTEDIWLIINTLQLGSLHYVFLIDQQGIIISHPDPSLVYHSLVPLPSQTLKQIVDTGRYGVDEIQSLNIPAFKVMVKAKQPGHFTYQVRSQIPQIVGFAPLATQPWVVGVSQPQAEFTAPLKRLIWLHGSSVVVVGGITAIMALLLGLSISQPIHALTVAAQALESDDFDAHVLELHQSLVKLAHRQDDIGQLVRVFLQMAEQVRTRDQKLKMQVQELRIEIDETKRAKQVTEITDNEYFQQLQTKIQKLKCETQTEYYQGLQTQVQYLKERSPNDESLNLSLNADGKTQKE